MVCCQSCKCVAERGASLRVTASQLSPERKTHPTSPWWRSAKPLVEHHNPTSRLRPLKVTLFSPQRIRQSLPAEPALRETLPAIKTKRAFPVAAGSPLCLISGWMVLAPPVLLVPEESGCLPSSPNLGHKPFAGETESTEKSQSFPKF